MIYLLQCTYFNEIVHNVRIFTSQLIIHAVIKSFSSFIHGLLWTNEQGGLYICICRFIVLEGGGGSICMNIFFIILGGRRGFYIGTFIHSITREEGALYVQTFVHSIRGRRGSICA